MPRFVFVTAQICSSWNNPFNFTTPIFFIWLSQVCHMFVPLSQQKCFFNVEICGDINTDAFCFEDFSKFSIDLNSSYFRPRTRSKLCTVALIIVMLVTVNLIIWILIAELRSRTFSVTEMTKSVTSIYKSQWTCRQPPSTTSV